MHRDRAPAVAYLRTDVSGTSQLLEEHRIRRLSERFGYELRETIRTDATESARLVLLEDRIGSHKAEAVFVPNVVHLDGQLERIIAQADVIEQNGQTHARWPPLAYLLDDAIFFRFAQLWPARKDDGPHNARE